MRRAFLAAFLTVGASACLFAEDPPVPGLINLDCMQALVAIGRQELAGIFFFVPEKDGPQAFADLLVHDLKSLKKFLARVERDKKAVGGISAWDRKALEFAVAIYDSPIRSTLKEPGEKVLVQIRDLSQAPPVSLEQLEAARRKP